MLIYILHNDRIYTFRLPKDRSGNYILNDFDSDGHQRNLTNITGIDGKWLLNSNDNVILSYNGKSIESVELKEYCFYSLKYQKKENIIIYASPGYEMNNIIRQVSGDVSLTIGNDHSCDICFLNNNISSRQIELVYKSSKWILKNLQVNIPCYVNKKRVDSANLSNLDSVFIMGLKILVMGNKLIFSVPQTMINFTSSSIVNEMKQYAVGNVVVEENVKDFYAQDDYFSKSPIFRKKYEKSKITITGPEDRIKSDNASLAGQLIPTILMSVTSLVSTYFTVQNYKNGLSNKESLITSLLMCVALLLAGVLWPIIENFASKIRAFIAEKNRIYSYKKYLKRKKKLLDETIASEKMALEFNNISLKECEEAILKKNLYLFSRNIDYEAFLSIKVGTGKILSDIEFLYQKPDLIVEKEKLLKDVDNLIEDFKYIDEAPFSISLKENKCTAFINSTGEFYDYLSAIILQLIALQDYQNLKIVVFTSDISRLNKIKNLNHCWNNDKTFRYFATNLYEAENVSSELIRIYNKVNNSKTAVTEQSNKSTYYLIISDNIEKYKNLKIFDKLIHDKDNNYFSALVFGNKITDVPTGCTTFVEYTKNEASFFHSEMDEKNILKFKPVFIDDNINFDLCVEILSNIPIKMDNEIEGFLPDKLGFLEMYSIGKIEQLNILDRWKNSSVVSTLAAPIGIDANGNVLNLDLHEKKHGPHGLIAGMTGSGKSEFIITYILSLAINYSPSEVQFVLIDYKGGGLAGAFENRKTSIKLPHLVGTITNLDTAEMNRTLVSINSELKRRQQVFNEAKELLNTGSIDIYKYQSLVREGTLKNPMSHLFIICDEFAELKAQQPEFMDELVSAARIGRSLGIHLILATQKPSGVVDEQIWSNSKFKVCCKVQTPDDSQEMINRPDAAYLKESGRFYLQVGYDEYFVMGQSGYSGVQYVPSETVVSRLDNSVSFVDNIGDVYKTITKKDNENNTSNKQAKLGEELDNILNYLVDIAKTNNYQNQQLWLNNVPKTLYYSDLVQKYNVKSKNYNINPIIGEYDDPRHQKQGFVSLPLTEGGNTYIIGANGMGKSTLLSTLIYSTIINHTPDEVNFYIVDFGAEKLRKFYKAPHVGDVLTMSDKQKIEYLFYMIDGEMKKRQKYYSDNGGSFDMDIRNGKSIFSNIIVIIYGLETFKESFDELYEGLFATIVRSCSKVGINFIVTFSSIQQLSYVISNNFPQKVLLNLLDGSDFNMFFDGYIPKFSKNPGRGLIEIDGNCLEFQSSIVFEEEQEMANLKYVIEKLNAVFPSRIAKIPTVPKHLGYDYIRSRIDTIKNVPLGINVITAQPSYYNFNEKISVISSANKDLLSKFIPKFAESLSLCKNNKVIVLNAYTNLNIEISDSIKYYNSDFKKVFQVLKSNIEKLNSQTSDNTFTIIILGYSQLNSHMLKLKNEDGKVLSIDELVMSSTNDSFKFIIYDSASSFKKLANGKLSNVIDNQSGIWLGPDYDSQNCIEIANVGYIDIMFNSESAVVVKDTEPEFIKISIN